MRKKNCRPSWIDNAKSYAIKVVRVSGPSPSEKLKTPENAAAYWRSTIARKRWFDENKEHLVVLLLSTRYNVLGFSLVAIGSMNECVAHPREIFRAAVAGGAYAIIVVHNHPSGDPSPSSHDLSLTRRLKESAEILQIRLLDHVIIGKSDYFSFEEVCEA